MISPSVRKHAQLIEPVYGDVRVQWLDPKRTVIAVIVTNLPADYHAELDTEESPHSSQYFSPKETGEVSAFIYGVTKDLIDRGFSIYELNTRPENARRRYVTPGELHAQLDQ